MGYFDTMFTLALCEPVVRLYMVITAMQIMLFLVMYLRKSVAAGRILVGVCLLSFIAACALYYVGNSMAEVFYSMFAALLFLITLIVAFAYFCVLHSKKS